MEWNLLSETPRERKSLSEGLFPLLRDSILGWPHRLLLIQTAKITLNRRETQFKPTKKQPSCAFIICAVGTPTITWEEDSVLSARFKVSQCLLNAVQHMSSRWTECECINIFLTDPLSPFQWQQSILIYDNRHCRSFEDYPCNESSTAWRTKHKGTHRSLELLSESHCKYHV